MHISIEDIIIRNATQNDVEALYSWWNDGRIMAHAGYPLGLKITKDQIINQLKMESDINGIRLIIEQNKQSIGEMVYRTKVDNIAEIGIKICDISKQNKGLGSIILNKYINCLFNEYNYQKIILSTDKKNNRAQYVYEKLGFEIISIEEDAWINQIGEKVSVVNYEILKSKYNKRFAPDSSLS